MNWEAAGAIGEIVGAAGVVASLVYLAVQIRQGSAQTELNTKAIHATAFQNLTDHHSTLYLSQVTNPEVRQAFLKATDHSWQSSKQTRGCSTARTPG